MSVVSGRWGQTERSAHPGRPGYPRLLGAMVGAQVLAGLALWVTDIGLEVARLAPGGGQANPFLPWQLDGLWSAVGAAGWATLVSWLIARRFVTRLQRRDLVAPSVGWSAVAVAIGGYGALALGHTTGIRVLLAVAITPLVAGLVAYAPDGRPRPWSMPGGRRARIVLAASAMVSCLAYTVPHPFAAPGSGGSYSSGVNRLAPGRTVQVDIGLSGHVLPTRLTGVSIGGGAVVRSVTLGGLGSGGAPLPASPAGGGQWLTLQVGLPCPASPTTVSQATLHYTVLGIAKSERVPLGERVQLACRR